MIARHRRWLPVGLLAVVALTGVACDDGDDDNDDDGPTPAPTTPTPFGPDVDPIQPLDVPPIVSASELRDQLLQIAESAGQGESGDEGGEAIISAWEETYPGLEFAADATQPDETTIAVYENVINSEDEPSEDNPHVVVFVVLDRNGGCAAGVASGYPSFTSFEEIDMAARECTTSGAAEQFAATYDYTFQ